MSLNNKYKSIIIPPISKTEAEIMMNLANKDVDDAERIAKGENVNIVRPNQDKDFRKFCKDYKTIKKERLS